MPEGATKALGRAVTTCRALKLERLAVQIEGELGATGRGFMRCLLVGPSGAGKSTTALSLLDRAGVDESGEGILPIGVAPTSLHLVELSAGHETFGAWAVQESGGVIKPSSKADLRRILAASDRSVRWACAELPGESRLPSDLSLVDAPGVGASGDELSAELLEEAVRFTDVYLLFVRTTRGLGPALPALEALERAWGDHRPSTERLLPVFTDVRQPGRVSELQEGLAKRFGAPLPEAVLVPRSGEVSALANALREIAADARRDAWLEERHARLLGQVVLPALGMAAERLRQMRSNREENARFATEQATAARSAVARMRKLVEGERKASRKALREAAKAQQQRVRAELLSMIAKSERLEWAAYSEELEETLQHEFDEVFPERAEAILNGRLSKLADRCAKLIEAYELEMARIRAAPPPGFSETETTAGQLLPAGAARGGLGYLNRLGGRGGVKLGVMNLGRKMAARYYRLLHGTKAPAELIRSGIPNATRRLGGALKFLAKRAWVIDVALFVLEEAWGALRGRARMEKTLERVGMAWLDGPDRTLMQRIKGKKAPPGILVQIDRFVDGAWTGEDPTGRAEADETAGVRGQSEAWAVDLESLIEDWKNEAAALASDDDELGRHLDEVRLLREEWMK